MTFWQSRSGQPITGNEKDSFLPDFTVIPDGTTAKAQIKRFEFVELINKYTQNEEIYYQIIWKIVDGEFKNREVTQKIKAFSGEAHQIDRALNMLKRIFDLCQYKPTHSNAPTTHDLLPMVNKIMGIKIREWQQPKKDGSGFIEGNFVSEVHAINDEFIIETGKKKDTPEVIESAFNRNPRLQHNIEEDLPF